MINVKHKISTRYIGSGDNPPKIYRSLIRHVSKMTLINEAVDIPCVINVLITDDEVIREYNRKFRGIDKATDVLSFPMQLFKSEGWNGLEKPDVDLDTQTVPLGDIIISTVTIKRNARRYKHTFEQETARMLVHSCLHLLGYDHGEVMQRQECGMMMKLGYEAQDGIYL